MTSIRSPSAFWLALLAAGLTGLVHHVLPGLHLLGDDYVVLRPWLQTELASTLAGSWDPTHLNPEYHRPITSLIQAVQFAVFGLSTRGLHLISLAGIAGIAWMIGIFVARETGRGIAAVAGVILFVVHPSLPDSAGAWIFNQMHLAACASMLFTLLSWQRRRDAGAAAWWPVFALGIIGFYVKEDTIMVLPAVITVQALSARLIGNMPPPPRRVVAALVATAAVLAAVRWLVLPEFYSEALQPLQVNGFDELNKRFHMLGFGPFHTLLVVTGQGAAERAASIVLSVLMLSGLAFAVARREQTNWSLWLTGGVLLAFVNLPQVAASGWGRDHLVLVSAVLILAAALQSVVDACPVPRRPAVLGLAAAGALVLAVVSNDRNQIFGPCTLQVMYNEDFMLLETQIVPDLRDHLKMLRAACAAGREAPPVEEMGTVTWRVGEWTGDATSTEDFRWAQAHTVTLIRRDALNATWSVRLPEASASNPVDVGFGGDDGLPITIHVTTAEWRDVLVPVSASWRTWLRNSYRVDVQTAAAGGVAPRLQLRRLRVR